MSNKDEMFEEVATPSWVGNRGKWKQDIAELMEKLVRTPRGKAQRRGFTKPNEAKIWGCALQTYLKRNSLRETYFVSRMSSIEDGKFWVYAGKRVQNVKGL